MSMRFDPGAPAEDSSIPLCVPEIRPGSNAWNYVKECLDTNFVSSVGPFVTRFEKEMAAYLGVRHAVATVNGTAALHVALLVAGVEPDDEVLVSTLTFIAPANAIRYVNAWPVFVDAEPRYWEMDPEKLLDFVERRCDWTGGVLRNRESGRRIRAILPVHILGHPCDLDPILDVARRYDLRVIEDATETLGGKYKGRNAGTLGDLACLSFNGNKLISTGGGGMLVTNDDALAGRARYLTTQAKDDPLEYVHGAVGFNYRLTNIQAALGCAQLEEIDAFIDTKHRIAGRYVDALRDVPGLHSNEQAEWATSVFWLFTILVDEDRYGMNSRALLHFLQREGIQTRPLWQPLHLSKAHQGASRTECSVAERLNRDALSLPSSVGLTTEAQDRVISVLRSGVSASSPADRLNPFRS